MFVSENRKKRGYTYSPFLLFPLIASRCTASIQAIQLAMPDKQNTIDSNNQDVDSKTRLMFIASLATPKVANVNPSTQKTNPPSQCAPPEFTISSRFIAHFLNLKDTTSFLLLILTVTTVQGVLKI
ncbi:MAG: hypothetical protein JSV75_05325 [Candidatus Bathyarchaeota archaeon]|nr:MAG: hypothetical protein JSV75_05325 [Candidatus Bathyarchaeota archaeon]